MIAFDRRLLTHMNWGLLLITIFLFGIGVLNLYSASAFMSQEGMAVTAYYQKQLVWGFMGFGVLILSILIDYRHLKSLAWPIFIVTIIALALVPVAGKTIYGARRWLDLGFFNFQPSELAKISTIIITARLLSRSAHPLDWKELFIMLGICSIPAALILIQPDLGTTLNMLLNVGGIILFRGLTPRVFKTCAIVIPSLIPVGWLCMLDYQRQRVLTFLNPGDDPLGAGYQIIQSQIAIGSGLKF